MVVRQGDVEGDVAVGVQADGELGDFEQASLQLLGRVREMAPSVSP
ncbi:hypothetical protein [Streptomyces flaveus]